MKQLSHYINEKLHIGSYKQYKDIEVRFDIKDSVFNHDELRWILEGCNKLKIIPDYLSKGQNTKGFINLVYEINESYDTNDLYHSKNIIRIRKDNNEESNNSEYIIRFIKCDTKDSDYYPFDPNEYYHSIKECFEDIIDKSEKSGFWKTVEKYR